MGCFRQFPALLALLAGLAGAPLLSGSAEAEEAFACEDDCVSAVIDALTEDVRHFMPLHFEASERFDSGTAQEACPVERDAAPKVHGVIIAPSYPDFEIYQSTVNDARLMADFLRERGVPDGFLTVLSGPRVTRDAALAALAKALRCVRERDQVVLFVTGDGSSYDHSLAARPEELLDTVCGSGTKEAALAALCAHAGSVSQEGWDLLQLRYRQFLSDYDEMLFFTSEVRAPAEDSWRNDSATLLTGIGALELSNFVAQVRNRGADAVVLIDTNFAAAFRMDDQQTAAQQSGAWFWNPARQETPPESALAPDLVPVFGAGQYAVIYSSTNDENSGDTEDKGSKLVLGHLALAFTEVLRAAPQLTLDAMAAAVRERMAENGAAQTPVFAASSRALRLLAPEAAAAAPGGASVEIISPPAKRGAAGVEEKSFTLVARYTGKARAARAIVDGELVPVDRNGQFRRDITDTGGKYAIPIRVLSSDFETLATAELKLREKEDEPVIAAAARKVALVIANQAYAGSDAFPALKTPLADAEAVAAVLRRRYGFVTELGEGAQKLDLFLKDASKAQIQQALYDLRQRLTPEDQLIVYYAGHGESDPDLGAFWVPADGQPKADFTWIAAEEITRELKRMNAGAILVISDSCYAGGLSRGSIEEAVAETARERYLAKASRLKARQLMASGGDEPVEDGGGGGHSVFAKALVAGLEAMPGKVFTASELFEQKVKPAVISAANATSEGQTPGFSRIARAGDEPGSEFVFQPVTPSP